MTMIVISHSFFALKLGLPVIRDGLSGLERTFALKLKVMN